MNKLNRFFKGGTKKLLAIVGLAILSVGGGILTAVAGNPSFNDIQGDFPTLQVAPNGGSWGVSTNANVGDTLNLMVWDHNSVVDTTANNVTIKVSLPGNSGTSFNVSGQVSADNVTPAVGNVTINVGSSAQLSYIPGSAQFYRNINGQMTAVNWPAGVNPDSVVTSGVNVGSQNGCWQYAQAVTIQVKVVGVNPAINTNKTVELAGGSSPFGNSANAAPGDLVNFKIFLQNTGDGVGINPMIRDTLDSHLTYVPNSSYIIFKQNNVDKQSAMLDSMIGFNGQTITWAFTNMNPTPDAAIYLIFQARVAGSSSFPVGQTTLQNCAVASFSTVSANTNCVSIIVTKNPQPVVTFSLRKEVTNVTLGDSKWYDQQLASAAPGDTVAYRLVMINTGNTPANNVYLKDVMPSGVTFTGNVMLYNKDYPNGEAISGNDIVGNGLLFPTLVNGNDNTQTVIFTGKITTNCSGQNIYNNLGQVIYNGAVVAQDSASLMISCTRGLIITKTIQDPADNQFKSTLSTPIHEGQVLTYQINVQNNGNVPVTNPVLWDILPNQVTYVNNSLAIDGEFMTQTIQNAFQTPQGILLTNLNPGMGKVITFQVRVVDCPPLGDTLQTNTAYVKADSVATISSSATFKIHVNTPSLLPNN